MSRAMIAAAVLASTLMSGCGTYRIAYRFPSQEGSAEIEPIRKHHAHGIGLIGGGGYFFLVHQMFPALIDYTGEQSVSWHCPTGLYEVSHHHRFWHNATAALISWLVIVNVYQPSQVEWRCVKATPETQETRSPNGVQDS